MTTTRITRTTIKRLRAKATRKPADDTVQKMASYLRGEGLAPVEEFRFLKDRRFRFDLALPDHKIGIEYEGGIFSNGRHTRGKGYAKDCQKYNLATIDGWRVLRFTSEDIRDTGFHCAALAVLKILTKHNSDEKTRERDRRRSSL